MERELKSLHELGSTVKDIITEYQGIVIGVTFWLNGCTRTGVQSRELKDGIPKDAQWFDEMQLVQIGETLELPLQPSRGGPMPDPKR